MPFIGILTKTIVVMQMFNKKSSMLQLIKTAHNRLNSVSALLQTGGGGSVVILKNIYLFVRQYV